MKLIMFLSLFFLSIFSFSSTSFAGDGLTLEKMEVENSTVLNFSTVNLVLEKDVKLSVNDDYALFYNTKLYICATKIEAVNKIGKTNSIPLTEYTYFIKQHMRV